MARLLLTDDEWDAISDLFPPPKGTGRWPVQLAGDKGYRADWIDQYLLDLGIQPVIPSNDNEDRDARGIEFDREAYSRRNIVVRLIG